MPTELGMGQPHRTLNRPPIGHQIASRTSTRTARAAHASARRFGRSRATPRRVRSLPSFTHGGSLRHPPLCMTARQRRLLYPANEQLLVGRAVAISPVSAAKNGNPEAESDSPMITLVGRPPTPATLVPSRAVNTSLCRVNVASRVVRPDDHSEGLLTQWRRAYQHETASWGWG
jgi:hypothetical protein